MIPIFNNLLKILFRLPIGNCFHMLYYTIALFAASVFNVSQKYKAVGKKALKMAVKLHLQNDHTDYLQLRQVRILPCDETTVDI